MVMRTKSEPNVLVFATPIESCTISPKLSPFFLVTCSVQTVTYHDRMIVLPLDYAEISAGEDNDAPASGIRVFMHGFFAIVEIDALLNMLDKIENTDNTSQIISESILLTKKMRGLLLSNANYFPRVSSIFDALSHDNFRIDIDYFSTGHNITEDIIRSEFCLLQDGFYQKKHLAIKSFSGMSRVNLDIRMVNNGTFCPLCIVNVNHPERKIVLSGKITGYKDSSFAIMNLEKILELVICECVVVNGVVVKIQCSGEGSIRYSPTKNKARRGMSM